MKIPCYVCPCALLMVSISCRVVAETDLRHEPDWHSIPCDRLTKAAIDAEADKPEPFGFSWTDWLRWGVGQEESVEFGPEFEKDDPKTAAMFGPRKYQQVYRKGTGFLARIDECLPPSLKSPQGYTAPSAYPYLQKFLTVMYTKQQEIKAQEARELRRKANLICQDKTLIAGISDLLSKSNLTVLKVYNYRTDSGLPGTRCIADIIADQGEFYLRYYVKSVDGQRYIMSKVYQKTDD